MFQRRLSGMLGGSRCALPPAAYGFLGLVRRQDLFDTTVGNQPD
jgi:hypothetical protein